MRTLRIAAVLLIFAHAGCVTRVMRIESDPPGAAVTLDGEPVGTTPLEVKFQWYGEREVILEKKGFESVWVVERLVAPWWQLFPFDFITDVLLPIPTEDRHVFRYELKPFQHGDYEKMRKRALETKKKAEQEN